MKNKVTLEKERLIKELIEKGKIEEQIRYDVSPMISVSDDKINEIKKDFGITEDELWEYIEKYSNNRKIFFFARINGKTFDEIKFRINNEVIKPVRKD